MGILEREEIDAGGNFEKNCSREYVIYKLAVACGAANTLLLGAGVLKREDVERFRQMVDVAVLE